MRKIYTYFDGFGCPVEDFILQSEPRVQKRYRTWLDYIRNEANGFSGPHIKHFSLERYSRLYEMRLKVARVMVRIIFYEHLGDIYFLHAFYKRDSKDTEKALETALKILGNACEPDGHIPESKRVTI